MTLTQEDLRPAPAADLDVQQELWRSTIRERLATMDVRPTGPRPVPASAQKRDLGDLLITDWSCGQAEGLRASGMTRRDPEALLLFTVLAGRQVVETANETLVLRPGGILMLSTRTAGRFVVPEPLRKRTVRIPLTSLAPYDTGGGVPDYLFLDAARSPLAGLAHDYLAGVNGQLEQMSPVEIEGARNALLVLVAGMIRATRADDVGEHDFLPFLRRRLESWIVEHLTAGAIRVSELAAAHNVAPRTVHRAFAATGDTVGSVVRAHRLAAARKDLVNGTCSIAAIAHRWGFYDASHLGREFRREFSMSPGDYRDAHRIA